jgi:hypothetical protein
LAGRGQSLDDNEGWTSGLTIRRTARCERMKACITIPLSKNSTSRKTQAGMWQHRLA